MTRLRHLLHGSYLLFAKCLYRILLLTNAFNVKPNRFIFISNPDVTDNSYYVFKYLVEKVEADKYELIWLCLGNVDAACTKLHQLFPNINKRRLKIIPRNSLLAIYLYARSTAVFASQGIFAFTSASRFGPIVVNLWHGMPLKDLKYIFKAANSRPGYSSYILSTAPCFNGYLASVFHVPISSVVNVGLPRNSVLLHPRPEIHALLCDNLHVPLQSEFIFWLPTFRKALNALERSDGQYESFLDDWPPSFLYRLDEELKLTTHHLIIKLHPIDILNRDLYKSSNAYLKNLTHIHLISSVAWEESDLELYAALATSIALISDVSSVMIDYVCTGRPLAVTLKSIAAYSIPITDNGHLFINSCVQITNEQQLTSFVKNPVANDNRIDYARLKLFNDHTEDTICDEILAQIGLKL